MTKRKKTDIKNFTVVIYRTASKTEDYRVSSFFRPDYYGEHREVGYRLSMRM